MSWECGCQPGLTHAGDCPTRCPACEYSGGIHAYDCPDLPSPDALDGEPSTPIDDPAGRGCAQPGLIHPSVQEGITMNVTNGQPGGRTAPQGGEKTLDRRAAEIYHAAGTRSDSGILRGAARADPEAFAGVLDALKDIEAGG